MSRSFALLATTGILVSCGGVTHENPNTGNCELFVDRIYAGGGVASEERDGRIEECAGDRASFYRYRQEAAVTHLDWHQARASEINRAAQLLGSHQFANAPLVSESIFSPSFSTLTYDQLPDRFRIEGKLFVSDGLDHNERPSVWVEFSNGNSAWAFIDDLPRSHWFPLQSNCFYSCFGSVVVERRVAAGVFLQSEELVAVSMQVSPVTPESLQQAWLDLYTWQATTVDETG